VSWRASDFMRGASFRDSPGLKAQDRLNFTLMPDGTGIMRVKNRMLADLAGIAGCTGPVIPLEDMKAWRVEPWLGSIPTPSLASCPIA